MSLIFRRRTRKQKVKGFDTWVNWSKSGASVSAKKGPITVNSRGRITIHTGIKGLVIRL